MQQAQVPQGSLLLGQGLGIGPQLSTLLCYVLILSGQRLLMVLLQNSHLVLIILRDLLQHVNRMRGRIGVHDHHLEDLHHSSSLLGQYPSLKYHIHPLNVKGFSLVNREGGPAFKEIPLEKAGRQMILVRRVVLSKAYVVHEHSLRMLPLDQGIWVGFHVRRRRLNSNGHRRRLLIHGHKR